MKVICDTNIFIHLFDGNTSTIEILRKIGSENVLLPSVVVMELYRGMSNKTELALMIKKLNHYNIIHYSEQVSEAAIDFIKTYTLSHGLHIPDAIIAATAVIYDIPLLTYNYKDFHFIKNIKLYDYTK